MLLLAVFRSLKNDLGLRPVFHQVERCVEGHLSISLLVYHFVHMLRLRLKAQGIDECWETLRQAMCAAERDGDDAAP
jgi:transposase